MLLQSKSSERLSSTKKGPLTNLKVLCKFDAYITYSIPEEWAGAQEFFLVEGDSGQIDLYLAPSFQLHQQSWPFVPGTCTKVCLY